MFINEFQKPWTRTITEEEWQRIFGNPLKDHGDKRKGEDYHPSMEGKDKNHPSDIQPSCLPARS